MSVREGVCCRCGEVRPHGGTHPPGAGSAGSSQLTAGCLSRSRPRPEETSLPSIVPAVSLGAAKDRWDPKACPFPRQDSSRAPSGQFCFLCSPTRVCPRDPSVHMTYFSLPPGNLTQDTVEKYRLVYSDVTSRD